MRQSIAAACMALMVGLVSLPAAGQARVVREADRGEPGTFSDYNVAQAIRKGIEFLLTSQQGEGSWPAVGKYKVGPTAAVTYSLLAAGVNPQSARLAKALKWMTANDTDRTYSLGLRCYAWHLANKTTLGKYRPQLKKDVQRLLVSGDNGSYHYNGTVNEGHWDNSCTQYGCWASGRAPPTAASTSPTTTGKRSSSTNSTRRATPAAGSTRAAAGAPAR